MRKLIVPFLFLTAAAVYGQGVQRGGTVPGPLPLFPRSNWWNVDVSKAPLDPGSSSFITFIGPTKGLHPDLGGDTGLASPNPLTYGMIYAVVPGTQPLRPVVFFYDEESDYGAPGRPLGYPIPDEAKTQTKWIEGGLAANDPNATGDRHMLLIDRDNRLLFELFATEYNATLDQWEAGSGAIFSLDSNALRPGGWTSADAAGLAIFPGLLRYDEAYGAGPIEHALRVTVRATNGYVFPGSHVAGSTSGALPMGARLRLKASKNITGYNTNVQKIFQAMKTYGLIVADNGSDMFISGTYDTRWSNDVLNPAFNSLKASDFEVVLLGWRPTPDFNKDGKPDLVWRNASTGAVNVWYMNGATYTGGASLFNVNDPNWRIETATDLDGNASPDLIWRNYATGEVNVWFMDGSQYILGSNLFSVIDLNWKIAAAGDVNGDGKPDLIWRNHVTGDVNVWFMNRATYLYGTSLFNVADQNWRIEGAGDFDTDGRADLIWRNFATGAVNIWYLDANGYKSGATLLSVTDPNWTIDAIADYNLDTHLDLIWRNTSTGAVNVWYMNGTTYVTGASLFTVSDQNWQISGPR